MCTLYSQISRTENTLYFGCRSSSKDHHYGDEWRMLVDSQSLVYRTSFSRDGPEGSKRIYVQDLMSQDEKKLWELLGRRGGWLYISGYVEFCFVWLL